ncbi:TOMM precursor leader peptide-binding protein [Micromonospora sp. DR5-3]|uniref:TOMM precursor leader peptide-binding protein n=1 Tax=unclassified Micromonospora TaxID=2617518 RepID=UPI0011D466A4|nr:MULTISPECIES: TOMM precursor leader peptide-binding protein [unclassified Micromonospora]MCW3817098.1 TOMM precursor leader peptide-binding protein [Micromonospora sp. DR5-3]TYC22374.1 TOMM precursor leader peptide-binding protein [Micromonospora sp. MP36]
MRPKLRHDVVFLDAPAGAYLRGPDSAFLIKGKSAFRWLTSLSPYLTGEHTLGQLTAALDPGQRQTVLTLVRALISRGFAKDAGDRTELPEPVARRFAAQIEFIDHFADDPTGRFQRFHTARVALCGGGEALLAAASGLLRNGCVRLDLHPDDDPGRYAEALRPELADLRADGLAAEVHFPGGAPDLRAVDAVVHCAGPAGLAHLAELARACHRDGPLLVPVLWDDRRAVVGPTVGAGRTPCWHCAQLRLAAGDDPAAAAEFWRQLAVGDPGAAAALPEVTARMLGNAAAFELFRALTGAVAPDTAGGVLLLDASTLESSRERVLPHPGCPVCRDVEVTEPGPPAASDDETYQRAEALVSPNAGVFTRFVDDPLEQAPLKTARLRLPGRRGPREVTAFDVHTVMGARLAAYRAAVRDHAARYPDLAAAVTASAVELRERGEHPVPWTELTSATVAPDDRRPIRWLPAVGLGRAESGWVPAALALPTSAFNAEGWAEPTVAGAAAAGTLDEVIDQGLADALAYRALTAALRGRGELIPVSEEDLVGDDDTAFVVKAAHRFGRRLSVFALAGAEPATAVLAVAEPPGGGDRDWVLAGGFDPVATRLAAVRDAVGRVQVRHFEDAVADLGDPVLRDLDPATLAAGATAAGPAGAATDRAAVLAALDAHGMSALLVETTTRDVRATGAFRSGVVLLRRPAPAAD